MASVAKEPVAVWGGLMLGAGLLAVLAAWWLPVQPGDRLGAFLGVTAAGFSGAVALPLKRRAMARSVQAALKVLGAIFALRMTLVLAGLLFAKAKGGGLVAFVLGFFGLYFVLQWLEIGYLLAEQKRRSGGRPGER